MTIECSSRCDGTIPPRCVEDPQKSMKNTVQTTFLDKVTTESTRTERSSHKWEKGKRAQFSGRSFQFGMQSRKRKRNKSKSTERYSFVVKRGGIQIGMEGSDGVLRFVSGQTSVVECCSRFKFSLSTQQDSRETTALIVSTAAK